MLVKYKPWSFIDAEQDVDMWGVELLEGDFAGTKISINSLKMEDDNPECAHDFTFIRKPEGKTEEQLQLEVEAWIEGEMRRLDAPAYIN